MRAGSDIQEVYFTASRARVPTVASRGLSDSTTA